MRSFRYAFRLTTAFLYRFRILIVIGVLIGICSFFLLQLIIPYFSSISSKSVGIAGRYQTNSLPLVIQNQISDGLTRVNDDGTIEAALAQSWVTPDKGKTWIFTLKDNLTWQDGSAVLAGDIVYEFTDVETEVTDDKTITFKLKEAFSPFPYVVSRPTFKKGLLGTGDWKVDKVSLANNIVHTLHLQNKYNKRESITYKFYSTTDQVKTAFKLGHVHSVMNLHDPSPFNNWGTASVDSEIDNDQIVTVFFNTNDEYLSSKSLRQALVYSLDKTIFDGERATGPISPSSWAYNPQVKKYDYSKDRVEELLGELPDEQREKMVIKLASSPSLLTVAEQIASQWNAHGIKTTVQVSSVIPSEFQAFLTIFDTPKDPDQYSIWHSTQTNSNISNYSNPRIDKLLEDGRLELDQNERYKIYLDFQRFLLEDLPAAFLYHPNVYTVSRK